MQLSALSIDSVEFRLECFYCNDSTVHLFVGMKSNEES